MCGYVAMYKAWSTEEIDEAMRSNESLGAIILNVIEDDSVVES